LFFCVAVLHIHNLCNRIRSEVKLCNLSFEEKKLLDLVSGYLRGAAVVVLTHTLNRISVASNGLWTVIADF